MYNVYENAYLKLGSFSWPRDLNASWKSLILLLHPPTVLRTTLLVQQNKTNKKENQQQNQLKC